MRYFLITLFFSLLLIASINYVIDPTGVRLDHIKGLPIPSDRMFVGNNIDVRLLKKNMLKIDTDSTVFILGSSRVLIWGQNLFPSQHKVLNLGVSSGTEKDYQFFINEILKHRSAKKVIIEISPWTFSKTKTEWTEQHQVFYQSKKHWRDYLRELKDLLSYPILLESYYSLVRGQHAGETAPLLGHEKESGYFSDGRRHYPEDHLNLSVEESTKRALKKSSEEHIRNLETGIDDEKLIELCELTSKLKRESIDVQFLILPYHPIAVQEIKKRQLAYTVDSLHQDLIKKINLTCKMEVLNLENLCSFEEFFDDIHERESCFKKVMQQGIFSP